MASLIPSPAQQDTVIRKYLEHHLPRGWEVTVETGPFNHVRFQTKMHIGIKDHNGNVLHKTYNMELEDDLSTKAAEIYEQMMTLFMQMLGLGMDIPSQ